MKIHIFGASGSGVTTLGQALAKVISVRYVDSDDYYWRKSHPPFTMKEQPDVRNKALVKDLACEDAWILGGSIISWGDTVFPLFDLVVFLYIPRAIRLQRLRERELTRYGESILEGGEREQKFNDFITWAAGYDDGKVVGGRTLQAHRDWLNKRSEPKLELVGDLSVEERLARIMAKLNECGFQQ